MPASPIRLAALQGSVVDVAKVRRNHTFPGTDDNENVVEHCFSVAMLCWKVYDALQPDLKLEKILKYALTHDFLERGLVQDVNTYADKGQRAQKEQYENQVYQDLVSEFANFDDMLSAIRDYENQADEEALFVKTVDKIQAMVLGELDDWRPYRKIGVTYQQFVDKGDEFMNACPDCLKETLRNVNIHSRAVFYDQPGD